MSRTSRRRGHSESWRKAENVAGAHESLPPPTKLTFLLLEAHRPASAVALTPKGWRRAQRYENLLLAAAVTKLQRDCLALTEESEWLGRGGRRTLLQGVWLTLRRVAPELDGAARRLSPRARGRAEARARVRFESICLAVSDRLRRAGELTEAPEPGRCTAITRRGTRCAHPARTDWLCAVHHRRATATAPTAIASSTAIARRMERSAGLLSAPAAPVYRRRSRPLADGRKVLAGGFGPIRRAALALTAPDARRVAGRLRSEIVAHRRTASATAGFGVAAVLFALTGLPLGGGDGASYPAAGAIGAEGANAPNPPGLQASTGDATGALASRHRASGSAGRKRGRGAAGHGSAGGGAGGRSRLASFRSGGGGSPSGGGHGTTPGGSPAPSPAPQPSPSPSPSPAPSPAPSPSPSPQPSPSPPPTGTVSGTVNTVRQGASQTVNGVSRTVQGTVGHPSSGVSHVVAGVGG